MDAVTGVFRSRESARRAAIELCRSGLSRDSVNVLLPGATEEEIHSIPVSETEQPGVGAALGGVVGAAVGLGGGFELGAAAASLMLPGVGPVVAMGIAGAALLGLGGLMGGAALGSAVEHQDMQGLPADEMFFYEDALRQGRSVVTVLPRDQSESDRAHEVLADTGAESLDAAREAWWIGLRNVEAEHYHAFGHNFERDQPAYRAGFEAALRPPLRGKSFEEVAQSFQSRHPQAWQLEAFRRGFERGREYLQHLQTALHA